MIQMEQLLVDDEQQLAKRSDEPAADKRRDDMPAFLRGRRMTGARSLSAFFIHHITPALSMDTFLRFTQKPQTSFPIFSHILRPSCDFFCL